MLQPTASDFQDRLKQTRKESGNETQVEYASEPQQGNHSVDTGLHPRAHGKLCATSVQDNTRRSDMSQAGNQSGCLPSNQRNLDPNHTPPYTSDSHWSGLWDTTDVQVKEMLKKEQVSAGIPQFAKMIQK